MLGTPILISDILRCGMRRRGRVGEGVRELREGGGEEWI
jgi:hypothetical protein